MSGDLPGEGPPFRASSYELEGRPVVEVAGELDISTAELLRAGALAALADAHGDLVIDLSEVTFLDSTALGVLVAVHQHAQRRGVRVQLVCATARVLRPLRMLGIDRVIAVCADLRGALDAASTAPPRGS